MKKKVYIDFAYLIILASSFGAVMVLGVFVAPVIFHTDEIVVEMIINHYNAGIIMGEIFHRFSYWISFLAFFIMVYELFMYKLGQRDTIIFVSSVTAVFSSFMFSGVYSPKILSMQAIGPEATQSDTFKNLHMASELDFKILAISLLVLFIRRLMLLILKPSF